MRASRDPRDHHLPLGHATTLLPDLVASVAAVSHLREEILVPKKEPQTVHPAEVGAAVAALGAELIEVLLLFWVFLLPQMMSSRPPPALTPFPVTLHTSGTTSQTARVLIVRKEVMEW